MRITNHSVMNIKEKKDITFTFNGKQYTGKEGDSVAVALWSEKVRVLRTTEKEKKGRGIYCGIGNCYDCRVYINGRGLIRSCLTPLQQDMQIDSERDVKKI